MYFKLFMAITGAEADFYELDDNKWVGRVQAALFGSQIVQFTLMTMIAGMFSLSLEKGLYEAIKSHLSIIGRGGLLYFSFQMGTKAISYHNKVLYGDRGYVGTGRGLGLKHQTFKELFRSFGNNQTILGFELAFALVVYRYLSGIHLDDTRNQLVETFPLILVAVAFIWTPFVMNPSALNSDVIREDWVQFLDWIFTSGGEAKESWETWHTKAVSMNSILNPWWKRLWYVFLPSCRKLGLVFSCAQLAYKSSQDTDMKFSSSLFTLFIVGVIFFLLVFLDAFLTSARHYRHTRALLEYMPLRMEVDDDDNIATSSKTGTNTGGGSRRESKNEGPPPSPVRNLSKLSYEKEYYNNEVEFNLKRWYYGSSRIFVWLIVSTVVITILLLLVARWVNVGVIYWHMQCLMSVMFWLLNDVLLCCIFCSSNDIRTIGHIPEHMFCVRGSFVRSFLQTIFVAMGAIIMIPLYLFSLLPFMNTLHNQLLFNDTFASKADDTYHARRIMERDEGKKMS